MKKLIILFALLLFLLTPVFAFACEEEDFIVQVKLGVNDGLKECRAYYYEAGGGYYKQMPNLDWRVIRFRQADTDFFKKYCELLGYNYSEDVLLPARWVVIGWKLYYAFVSAIIAILVLAYPFISERRKKR
jgi:hypothetical protein